MTHDLDGSSTTFFPASKSFSDVHKKGQICSLDVSPQGQFGLSGDTTGGLHMWDTNFGQVQRSFVGHVGDVSCCRFFPSGEVILSGGLDRRIKIWSIKDSSCPVTITASAGVMALALIERGRNFLASSTDGVVGLFDCGTGRQISEILPRSGISVNDVTVLDSPALCQEPTLPAGSVTLHHTYYLRTFVYY